MAHTREIYDLLSDKVAGAQPLEEVLIGLTWTLCRAGGTGLAMSPTLPTRTLPWSGTLAGRQVQELTSWLLSWDPYEATVAMAAVNAVLNTDNALCASAQPIDVEGVPGNLAVFEHFAPMMQGQRVVVVGRYPGLERYEEVFDLKVIERNPAGSDLPDPACEYLLPEAEWVFLTASSIPNKTFPRLAELSRDANLVLMGPTVPWLAELAQFGVDFVAGVKVTDTEALRRTVAEGGGTRIFEGAVRYHVVDLGLAEMEEVKAAIVERVVHTEHLKEEMDAWYSGPWQGSFPRVFELESLYRELSDLDLRYKRLWDARNGGKRGLLKEGERSAEEHRLVHG